MYWSPQAVIRTPRGLELAGVELTDRGYIKVNERLQTTAPGVWAIGEVAGNPQFTHISIDDFRVVHANLTGGNRVTTGRQVPYTVDQKTEIGNGFTGEAERCPTYPSCMPATSS